MRNHYSKYEITKGSCSLVPCRRKGVGGGGEARAPSETVPFSRVARSVFGIALVFEIADLGASRSLAFRSFTFHPVFSTPDTRRQMGRPMIKCLRKES